MSIKKPLYRDFSYPGFQLIHFSRLSDDQSEWVRQCRNHPDVRKWMYTDHVISTQEHRRFLAGLRSDATKSHWLVQNQESGNVGVLGFSQIDEKNRSAIFAIYGDPTKPVPGLGRDLDRIACDLAFGVAGLDILKLEVLATNKAVINLHKKMGFEQTGILKNRTEKNGEKIDALCFEIRRLLLIRVDASPQMGMGHFFRCLALGLCAVKNGCRCRFLMCDFSPAIVQKLHENGIEFAQIDRPSGSKQDAKESLQIAAQSQAQTLLFDAYSFLLADYLAALNDAAVPLAFIDDNGHTPTPNAAYIINQNIHANLSLYPGSSPKTKFLLGLDYFLLRPEFQNQSAKKIDREVRDAVLTFGGSDPKAVTERCMEALARTEFQKIAVKVIVGPLNQRAVAIKNLAAKLNHRPGARFSVLTDPPNVAREMIGADFAVSAGGTTCAELMALGVPLAAVIVAENQRAAVNRWAEKGVLLNLGDAEKIDTEKLAAGLKKAFSDVALRQKMQREGLKLVDGLGAQRIFDSLRLPGR